MTALIGVDWGSTSVRALRIAAGGAVLEVREAPDGVFAGSGPFADRLSRLIDGWPAAPILLCGMVGSDRGWRTASYVPAPASAAALAAALLPVPFARPAFIVPGMSAVDGVRCEVMRGEETLAFGLGAADAALCLPGTHSKWLRMAGGDIIRIQTYMTGELRAALLAHGALATGVPQAPSDAAFAAGLDAARDGVSAALFQARARRLLGRLAAAHTAAFVEGVLIGEELIREDAGGSPPLHLVASGAVAQGYAAALARAARPCRLHDPQDLAAAGLHRLARLAGLCA